MKHKKSDNLGSNETSLDARALRYIETKEVTSVKELYDALKLQDPSVSKNAVTELVWRLSGQNKLDLDDSFPVANSFVNYLRMWERNLWLYLSLTISFLTLLAVYVLSPEYPFVTIRWILGSMFVLFIPGYVTLEALFPRSRELDSVVRFATSIGLSLALVPLLGLLLNYTVWGIRLTPVVISLVIFTGVMSALALLRHYRLETTHH